MNNKLVAIRMPENVLKMIDNTSMNLEISRSLFYRKIFKLGYTEWIKNGKPDIFTEKEKNGGTE